MIVEQAERERRAAQNQLLFRAVNEQIVVMTENFRSDLSDINLVCECWMPSCTGTVRCRIDDYERFDRNGNLFLVLPGHEDLLVEDVIEQVDGYIVVRKRDLAARIVEEAQGAARDS
ncbi:MAG: hypothetical protein QOF27_937 [Gaiellaceae bacterium]|nr:hypothetical protein [Gaiellaceae bacterium]